MRVEEDIFLVCGSVGFQSLESFKDPLWKVASGTDNLHLSPDNSSASYGSLTGFRSWRFAKTIGVVTLWVLG